MSEHWIDAHVHLVDFVQRSADIDDLWGAFADCGVERAVVFGVPVKKKWSLAEPVRPTYYLDDNAECHYHSLTDLLTLEVATELESRGGIRTAPLVCGFDPTDQLAIEHLELVWSRSDRWAGVGEVMMRHDDLTNLTVGEVPAPDHPAMDDVLAFCGERQVPLSLHHDAGAPARPGDHEYTASLENALRRHRSTPIVWCHAGVSRRVEPVDQVNLLRDLLPRHANLTVELSWVLLDHIVDASGAHPDWVALVDAFPERFVVGSDTVARGATIRDRARQILRFGDALAPRTRDRVLVSNATSLWFR